MKRPLALLGGEPTITRPKPHFAWPPITADTIQAVVDQLHTDISIYGRSGVVKNLEDALANYHGVRHAVLTSSGTAAIHSLYGACTLGSGDEVIVPAYTFFATATPLLYTGALPVLADSDEHGNLDPEDVARRITTRTVAIMVTHMWGRPADVSRLQALAQRYGLQLLEDGSHAHGATVCGRSVGTFGRGAAFSMNGPKTLSAGEGGFVLTDDDDVYYGVLLQGQYNKRCRAEIPGDYGLYPYATTGRGLKFRIHSLAAAIALEQLSHLDEYLVGRDRTARYMIRELDGISGIKVPTIEEEVKPSWYGMILQYRSDELDGLPIERFVQALLAEGCCEVDIPGSTCPLNHHPLFQEPGALFPAYRGRFSYRPGDFPQAEAFHRTTLKLPVWHREEDLPLVDAYIRAIRKVVENCTYMLE